VILANMGYNCCLTMALFFWVKAPAARLIRAFLVQVAHEEKRWPARRTMRVPRGLARRGAPAQSDAVFFADGRPGSIAGQDDY